MSEPTCPVCSLFEHPSPDVVFLSDEIMVVMPSLGLAPGHVQVFPRTHVPLLEQLSHDELTALFSTANALSSVLFELVRAQGTNLIVQNGLSAGQSVAHTSMHIIPRRQDDGIDFNWELKRADQAELTATASALKDNFVPLKSELKAGEKKPLDLDRKPVVMSATKREDPKPTAIGETIEKAGSAAVASQDDKKRKKAERINYLLKQLERMP